MTSRKRSFAMFVVAAAVGASRCLSSRPRSVLLDSRRLERMKTKTTFGGHSPNVQVESQRLQLLYATHCSFSNQPRRVVTSVLMRIDVSESPRAPSFAPRHSRLFFEFESTRAGN